MHESVSKVLAHAIPILRQLLICDASLSGKRRVGRLGGGGGLGRLGVVWGVFTVGVC